MDPALIYGPYGAIVCLLGAVWWLKDERKRLVGENKELRDEAMDLLKKYQDRDDEERRWRVEQERRRTEGRP